MAKTLTAKAVEAAKPDPARRLELPDSLMSGLYLVVQPGGAKGWALRYRFDGKPRKLTLGRYPAFGLKDARDEAGRALRLLEHGTDPGEAKRAEKVRAEAEDPDRDTLAAVIGQFLRRHASRNRRADDVAAMFRREVLGEWSERRIQDITKRDIVDLLDAIVDRGSPVTANRLRAHLNTLFNWAKGRDILKANPLDGVRPPAHEKPRDRVLSDAEVRLFWRACDRLGEPFGPLFKLLLLTGQRRGEVAGMTGREIAGDLWVIPAARAKNGEEHAVPLSSAARGVLAGVTPIAVRAGYMFTTTGESAVSGFSRARERLAAIMHEIAREEGREDVEPIEAFTLHDMRRSAATGMAGLGFPPHVVEAVLNHKSGTRRGVAGVYNRFDYADEKRAALEAWGRRVLALMEGEAGNVIEIRAAQ
jgi:integrase